MSVTPPGRSSGTSPFDINSPPNDGLSNDGERTNAEVYAYNQAVMNDYLANFQAQNGWDLGKWALSETAGGGSYTQLRNGIMQSAGVYSPMNSHEVDQYIANFDAQWSGAMSLGFSMSPVAQQLQAQANQAALNGTPQGVDPFSINNFG